MTRSAPTLMVATIVLMLAIVAAAASVAFLSAALYLELRTAVAPPLAAFLTGLAALAAALSLTAAAWLCARRLRPLTTEDRTGSPPRSEDGLVADGLRAARLGAMAADGIGLLAASPSARLTTAFTLGMALGSRGPLRDILAKLLG
jgi:hypothetical protein